MHTDLEHCVLGVIWLCGPCSAYSVRKEFEQSPSAYWSASTGSIYPVVKRLTAAGLVTAASVEDGRRTRDLKITESGLKALRRWISLMDRASTAATYDPVRTKFTFLDAMPAADLRVLIETAAAETTLRIAELREREDRLTDRQHRMERIAMRGARYELEARLRWLTAISDELAS